MHPMGVYDASDIKIWFFSSKVAKYLPILYSSSAGKSATASVSTITLKSKSESGHTETDMSIF